MYFITSLLGLILTSAQAAPVIEFTGTPNEFIYTFRETFIDQDEFRIKNWLHSKIEPEYYDTIKCEFKTQQFTFSSEPGVNHESKIQDIYSRGLQYFHFIVKKDEPRTKGIISDVNPNAVDFEDFKVKHSVQFNRLLEGGKRVDKICVSQKYLNFLGATDDDMRDFFAGFGIKPDQVSIATGGCYDNGESGDGNGKYSFSHNAVLSPVVQKIQISYTELAVFCRIPEIVESVPTSSPAPFSNEHQDTVPFLTPVNVDVPAIDVHELSNPPAKQNTNQSTQQSHYHHDRSFKEVIDATRESIREYWAIKREQRQSHHGSRRSPWACPRF